jgi:hypothetical protein
MLDYRKFKQYRVFYGSQTDGIKIEFDEDLWGLIQFTTTQMIELSLFGHFRFTHIFIIIGLEELYNELFWLIRSGVPTYSNVRTISLLTCLDGAKTHTIKKGKSLDSQSIISVQR